MLSNIRQHGKEREKKCDFPRCGGCGALFIFSYAGPHSVSCLLAWVDRWLMAAQWLTPVITNSISIMNTQPACYYELFISSNGATVSLTLATITILELACTITVIVFTN